MLKPTVTPLQFETYLAMINNSVGTYLFKNLYVRIDGKKKDASEDGWLSCAFYVSSILCLSKYIKEIHGTVSGTIRDLKKSGWKEVKKPVVGSVIVWRANQGINRHAHIGFYVGKNMAISNDSRKKYPIKYDWKFKGKRDIELILWKPGLNN